MDRSSISIQNQERLVRPQTVSDFQKMNRDIYGPANEELSIDRKFLILTGIIECGITKHARKDNPEKILYHLPHAASWLCAVANDPAINVDLNEALFRKFPGICPRCLREDECMCALNHPPEIEGHAETIAKHQSERWRMLPILRDQQLFHGKLFSARHQMFDLLSLTTRVGEEVGEAASAYIHGERDNIALELADAASFLFAVVNRMNKNRPPHDLLYLDDLTWRAYPYACPSCHRNVCVGGCIPKF